MTLEPSLKPIEGAVESTTNSTPSVAPDAGETSDRTESELEIIPEPAMEVGSLESFTELPESLSMLFVDDDAILRKLFVRTLGRLAPNSWEIDQAPSGENCLELLNTRDYDVIFLDQYMASSEKSLLGSETASQIRRRGMDCIICGLSANDVAKLFEMCGADAFLMKPFPCKPAQLKAEMLRVLNTRPSAVTRMPVSASNDETKDSSPMH